MGAESSADVRIPALAPRWAIIRREADGEFSLRHVPTGARHALRVGEPLRIEEVVVELRAERAELAAERLDVTVVSDALSQEQSSERRLRALVRTTMQAASAEVGALLVLEDGAPVVAVAEQRSGAPVEDPLALLSDTIVRAAFGSAEQVNIEDASRDERYRALPSVVGLHLRAVVCVPMVLEGRVVAVLYLGRSTGERPFASELARDLGVLASMCVPLLVESRRPRPAPESAGDSVSSLEGEHASMVELRRLIARLAPSTLAVFIHGETGAGKELVARALHLESARRALPFVAVNCGAIAENLLAAELFGVKKGAFTGAHVDREGLVESARGGTLFLDELADMPLPMQAALLRVLERREVVRVGDTAARPVDFRLVCATHRSLDDEVAHGRFRADLLFRVREVTLELPPLRERGDDVLLLARRFAKLAAHEIGERAPTFTSDALRRLREHPWPGNVRELRSAIRRAVVLSDGGVVHERDLGLTTVAPAPAPVPESAGVDGTLDEAWRRFSAELATRALERADGQREVAAAALGVSVRTLYRLLRER